ncbi:haloalkane dehalogenase [Ktedonobacter sp. SOSP1-85]|uniref:haloalkane dehalogenase n=1 Tax=Ktedonobacter sp. SOSP1-85 TaxID=2778367 RepID=UPI0019163015|nr:haloalkane dehalogenase [Ktedonobacter sp. SOSP1-85]GHO80373.1 haloalkane dehalogenase [Ktedonobacter sp. SOSP1-85]
MEVLRTPDERFVNLPDYPFEPHYLEVDGLRVHYIDEGPREAAPVLLLHGEPSWSYLYRGMIPLLVAAGHRVIAPDLVGFGRSDKPTQREDYTYKRHVDWMHGVLNALDLRQITLFCQDWGGLIGLRLVGEQPERFARVIAANTFLPTGDQPPNKAFLHWQRMSQTFQGFQASRVVKGGCVTPLTPEEVAAYDAPFPDERYLAGALQFPLLVPTRPDDPASEANRAAWEVLCRWEKPFLTAFSDSDPITRGGDAVLQALIPGAKGQPHTTITSAGHFLQEDKGPDLARIINEFIAG